VSLATIGMIGMVGAPPSPGGLRGLGHVSDGLRVEDVRCPGQVEILRQPKW
jgi:hypothetical protein